MKVTLILCDYAQACDQKLNIIGGGWSIRGGTTPMAIAMKVEVPWVDANRPHPWKLSLFDADGVLVQIPSAVGAQAVEISGQMEVGRPAGLPEGTPLDVPLAINMAPFPLLPGRYEWRLEIDAATQPDWHVSFLVRGSPSGSAE
jgi:hypothetical protein